MMGDVDAGVLERLAKIMSYMRPAAGGTKPGKRLKRREKLRMLGEPPSAQGLTLHGATANGGFKAAPRPDVLVRAFP